MSISISSNFCSSHSHPGQCAVRTVLQVPAWWERRGSLSAVFTATLVLRESTVMLPVGVGFQCFLLHHIVFYYTLYITWSSSYCQTPWSASHVQKTSGPAPNVTTVFLRRQSFSPIRSLLVSVWQLLHCWARVSVLLSWGSSSIIGTHLLYEPTIQNWASCCWCHCSCASCVHCCSLDDPDCGHASWDMQHLGSALCFVSRASWLKPWWFWPSSKLLNQEVETFSSGLVFHSREELF